MLPDRKTVLLPGDVGSRVGASMSWKERLLAWESSQCFSFAERERASGGAGMLLMVVMVSIER